MKSDHAFINGDLLSNSRQPGKLLIFLKFANICLYDDVHSILKFFSVLAIFDKNSLKKDKIFF